MAIITDLAAYWGFEGNLNDSKSNNNLTNNGVTFVAGLVGQAGNFVAASNQFGEIESNSEIILGDIPATIAGWLNFTSTSIGNTTDPFSKWVGASANLQNYLIRKTAGDRMQFLTSSDGTNIVSVENTVAIVANIWYFVAGRHDPVANTIDIRVNTTDATPSAFPNGIFTGAARLDVGCITTGTTNLDGKMDEWGIWKRRLSDTELDWLYNSGNGRSYTDILAEAGGTGLPFFTTVGAKRF